MGNIVISEYGKVRRMEDIEAVENITEKRKKKDPWIVIDELVKLWAKRAPDEEQMVQLNVREYRESMIDKKYGQTTGGRDQERRFTLAFPRSLMLMIRAQYKADELPMDREFYRKFARRYPAFKVATHL